MDDWNDHRLVLAVTRAGSLTAAAKTLGVDHSTVFRRLAALEARLGLPLFERVAGGAYTPTEAGAHAAAAAERMEDAALGLARDLAGQDRRLAGRLRITCSETLAFRLLTPWVGRFRAEHPGIAVEIVVDSRVLNLSRREADVALRVARPREGDLWGRKLADVAWTAYGAASHFAAAPPLAGPRDLAAHPLIGWEEATTGVNAARWLAEIAPPEAVVYRTGSLVNQMVAARAGLGLALLPCYLGDPEPGLARALPEPIPELSREMWIVTHRDLRNTARIRAFFDTVTRGLQADRALIEGRGTVPAVAATMRDTLTADGADP
ncbi:LysR family transcriptional regulator [Roseomonas rosulenta]|uniref:LysR family transcriptional regulator n=1 Tax=Roseomonas rosulenta TaxID=2748667 RepID=UPI0018DFC486|nr:LysR family transcriptional regulator [Roseomonas rosulenta]